MRLIDFNLSITEEFVTLTLLGKSMFKSKKLRLGNDKAYTITSAFIELFLDEKIALNEKQQVVVTNSDLTGKQYIDLILATLASKKPMKLIRWIEHLYVNSKLGSNICNSIAESIISKKVLELETKDVLLGNRKEYKDINNIGDCIIQKIRAELLEDGQIGESTLYLALLADGNKMLMRYFSEYEYKAIKEKMEQLYETKESEKYKVIKKAIDEIEINSIFALLLGLV
ncbi:hypothetical protein J2Z44_004001 [Clostridium punense]|uniref:GPP34 family phosphoprotein n=1 Tax=Clostridium punense TaxID=1054297 RepID=A0ABS4K8P2_9CLOT|nr:MULTISPECIES: GPP34 family phosphoprotein [Clostridium]EQB89793.1 hypothetical protein M918_18965 [Clostridium sp. BL8]MBP2024146.1 hypothetical protein [Clostridium punense]